MIGKCKISANEGVRRVIWLILVCIGQTMLVLDVSVVTIIAPLIQRDFSISLPGLGWISGAYALTFGSLLMLGGNLADVFGRWRMFRWGLAAFAFSSFACGIALNPTALILARVCQGASAALAGPAAFSLVTTIFHGSPRRATAVAIFSAFSSAGALAGTVLGGTLADIGNWRWVFLINVFLAFPVIVTAILIRRPRESAVVEIPRVQNALMMGAGLGLVTFAGYELQYRGSRNIGYLLVALGVLALLYFVVLEKRPQQHLIGHEMLRCRGVAPSNILSMVSLTLITSSTYLISLYLQDVIGWRPIEAALAFVPNTTSVVLLAILAPRAARRVGVRTISVVSIFLFASSMWWLRSLTKDSTYVGGLLPPLMLIAVASALSFGPLALAAVENVPKERHGVAASLLQTSQQIGSAIGLMLLPAVAAGLTTSMSADTLVVVRKGFEVSAVFAIFGVLPALWLPGRARGAR
jgi:EmrB/QacA subfamily drug resistance transporter